MIKNLLNLDAILSAKLRLEQSSRWWKLIAFMAHSGDSWFWMLALVIIWFAGNLEWHQKSGLMAAAVAALAILVISIKFSIRRQRPPGEWGAIYRNTDPHSFPSGHAARAGLLAVMAASLGPPWFGILIVIWSPLVSLARVATGVHYFSDILAGLVLGIAAGFAFLAFSPWIMATFPIFF